MNLIIILAEAFGLACAVTVALAALAVLLVILTMFLPGFYDEPREG
jgi:hypothetical protein